jgi:hypothetical protein
MTIYELKQLNTKNGGVFFHRDNMKANRETMKDFSIRKLDKDTVLVTNKKTGTEYKFNANTGRVIND